MIGPVTLRDGNFVMALYPDQLQRLQLPKIRKLFRLFNETRAPQETIDAMRTGLQAAEEDAKTQFALAVQQFQNGWTTVPDRAKRTKLWAPVRGENRRLKAELKRAQRACERAKKINNTFREIVN